MNANYFERFDFFTGVPDSQLKALCEYLLDRYGLDPRHHVIAANEGNCVALAAGYYLATGKIPVVYMQNSGEGNAINPLASLLNDKVYGIPCVLVIGWRGEPGVHDEPQHVYQGEITLELLRVMGIEYFVIDKDTTAEQVDEKLKEWDPILSCGKQVAFVVKKGALKFDKQIEYKNEYKLSRARAIEIITEFTDSDPVISTTGKASRELFEIREKRNEGHGNDFLTVGGMGHASSIALGIAVNKPNSNVWCIDGDGALIMHAGALATIGYISPKNFKHIVINNVSHESVGGMSTVANTMNITEIAKNCGYATVLSATDEETLKKALEVVSVKNELCLVEVKCSIGARSDLGRPTTTAAENKVAFMKNLGLKV